MSLLRNPRLLSSRARALISIHRPLSTTTITRSSWSPGPSPPRLPKEDQEIFEQLQSQSTGAFSTRKEEPRPSPMKVNQSPASSSEESTKISAQGEGEELHPNVRRGAPPEFEGDVNPKTGEVGGPKNEPLRWGHSGDWSYNGRVTDF